MLWDWVLLTVPKIGSAIHMYQTLVAGLMAVGVGIVTIRYIQKQIQQNDEFRKDDLARRHRTMKAGLPLALAQINEYARRCFNLPARLEKIFKSHGNFPQSMIGYDQLDVVPRFPFDAFETVRISIETAKAEEAKKLAAFVSFGQVHLSRLEGYLDDLRSERCILKVGVAEIDAKDRMLDSAILFAASDWILPYARDRAESIEGLPSLKSTGILFSDLEAVNEEKIATYLTERWDVRISDFKTEV